MATDVETLELQMRADIRNLEKSMLAAQRASDKAAEKIESRFDRMNDGVTRGFRNMGDAFKKAIAAVAVGALVKDVQQLADSYTSITNQLRSFADVLGDTDKAQARLVETAVNSNANLEASAAVLAAAARSARELGKSGDDVFAFTEAVGKGAAIANTGAAAVAGAITQLGQAVASPSVQLGEFNSIIEGTPRLSQAFADGIERAGGSVSKLRKLIGSGQVSGSQLFEGLLTQLPRLRAEFASSEATVADAFTNLKTRLTAFVGEANQASGTSKIIGGAINALANNVNALAEAVTIVAFIIAGQFAGKALVAATTSVAQLGSQVLATRAAVALAATAYIEAGMAAGTMSTATAGAILRNVQYSASANVATLATTGLQNAMAGLGAIVNAFGGPYVLAITAFVGVVGYLIVKQKELIHEVDRAAAMQRGQKTAAEQANPILARLKQTVDDLAKAEGAYAAKLAKSRDEMIRNLTVQRRLAATRVEDARKALRDAEVAAFDEVGGPLGIVLVDPTVAGNETRKLKEAREALAEARAELERFREAENDALSIAFGIGETAEQIRRRRAGDTASAPTSPAAPDTGRASRALDPLEEQTRRIEENFDRAEQEVEEYNQRLLDTFDSAERLNEELRSDAESFLDRLPGSTRAAMRELAALRALISKGIFKNLDAEHEGAMLEVQLLEEIAYQAGETALALAELKKVSELSPEEAARAAERIRRAAREGAAARDEELGKLFRKGEIRDDVKSALREAMRTGDYAEIFREKMADAFDRAADRAIDRFVDLVFDGIGSMTKGGGGLGGVFGGGGGKGDGGFWPIILSTIGSIFGFGGARANGGPVSPGRWYMTGERGPEPFIPKQPGYIIPNGIANALNTQPRQAVITQRTEMKIAYSIDLSGANGDTTIRQIAREEAKRGAAEAIRIADTNAPYRSKRFNQLGS